MNMSVCHYRSNKLNYQKLCMHDAVCKQYDDHCEMVAESFCWYVVFVAYVDESGVTPAHFAAQRGHLDCLRVSHKTIFLTVCRIK